MNAEQTGAPAQALTEDDKAAVTEVFERVKATLPGFTPRRSQNVMIAEVARAVGPESGGVAVVEAGTGCGKSLGYLVPAIPLASRKEKKLVVSTGTIALQEQLMAELPELLKSCGRSETVALAKGRQRYVCVRDLLDSSGDTGQDELGFEEAVFDFKPSKSDLDTISTLAEAWSKKTWNGDMDNAPVAIGDGVRSTITTTAGGCSGRACRYFNECPMVKARAQVREADIVLVNHSLLLIDLQVSLDDQPLICDPADAVYCIDEAHQFAQDAIDAGACHVPLTAAVKRLKKIGSLVPMIYRAAEDTTIEGRASEDVQADLKDIAEAMAALEGVIRLHWTPRPGDRDQDWRAPEGRIPEDWTVRSAELAQRLGSWIKWLAAARKAIKAKSGRFAERVKRDAGMLAERLQGYRDLFCDWSKPDVEGVLPTARWVTMGHENGIVCHASPTNASEYLNLLFWGRAHAAVFTSATLSAGGDFSAFSRDLALPHDVRPRSLPSPFDLESQATLEVPFFVNEPNSEQHPAEVVEWLERDLDWTKASLVLFTSRRKMEQCAGLLSANHRKQVKVQGDMGKAELIQRHKQDIDAGKGSVLFGLQSLGEGIDLRGEYCSTVVITQLPFARPTDPVKATLAEWMQHQGMNPFMALSLPEALLRLTQYAGRLIRTETDTGRIVITDSRLRTKRYGNWFLDGLPPFRKVVERRPRTSRQQNVS